MALNTWHVWQYVIGIDITLSPSRMYTAFFYGGCAKATVCGLLMAATASDYLWRQVLCHLSDADFDGSKSA